MKRPFHFRGFIKSLFFVTLFTIMLGVCAISVYAAYRSSVELMMTLKVAKFEVKFEETDEPITEMKFNESGDQIESQTLGYHFSVISNSEVAIDYSVKLTFTAPPPQNVRLWIDDETHAQACDGKTTEFVFSGFECEIGDTAKEHTLSVMVDYVTVDENGDSKLIEFDPFTGTVNITVIAEQKVPTR